MFWKIYYWLRYNQCPDHDNAWTPQSRSRCSRRSAEDWRKASWSPSPAIQGTTTATLWRRTSRVGAGAAVQHHKNQCKTIRKGAARLSTQPIKVCAEQRWRARPELSKSLPACEHSTSLLILGVRFHDSKCSFNKKKKKKKKTFSQWYLPTETNVTYNFMSPPLLKRYSMYNFCSLNANQRVLKGLCLTWWLRQ